MFSEICKSILITGMFSNYIQPLSCFIHVMNTCRPLSSHIVCTKVKMARADQNIAIEIKMSSEYRVSKSSWTGSDACVLASSLSCGGPDQPRVEFFQFSNQWEASLVKSFDLIFLFAFSLFLIIYQFIFPGEKSESEQVYVSV